MTLTRFAIGPNLASRDMVDMFTHPQLWRRTLDRISGFRFTGEHIIAGREDDPEALRRVGGVDGNTFPRFAAVGAFSKLREWGKDTLLHSGAVKFGDCEGDGNFRRTVAMIDAIHAEGGYVNCLAVDSSFDAAKECGHSYPRSTELLRRYCMNMWDRFPDLEIGVTEQYQVHPLQIPLEHYPQLLKEVNPHYFSLDVDRNALKEENFWRRLFNQLTGQEPIKYRTFKRRWRVLCDDTPMLPKVILVWGGHFTSAMTYRASVISWAKFIKTLEPRPSALIVESWEELNGVRNTPDNLPEERLDTHTGMLLDIAKMFDTI